MVHSKFSRWTISALLCVGMTINGRLALGSEPPSSQASKPVIAISLKVRDVALADGGILAGQLVGPTGKPISGETIYLANRMRIIATTTSRADGSFEMAGLSNGNYGLASRQSCALVRLWQAGTAPPAATKKTLLVASGKTVRSQSGISDGLFRIGEALGIVAIPLLVFGAAIILQGYRGGKQSNAPFGTPH